MTAATQTQGTPISRELIQQHFAACHFAFAEMEPYLEQHRGKSAGFLGQPWPRLGGHSADALCVLELIGPPEALRLITVVAGAGKVTREVAERNTLALQVLLGLIAPTWLDRDRWLARSLRLIPIHHQPARATYNNLTLALKFHRRTGLVTLEIHIQNRSF